MNTIMKTYILLIIALITFPVVIQANTPLDSTIVSSKKFTIVLDAGHGGNDPGKKVGSVNEKDIALKVVKKIGALLNKNPDIKVVYTRTTDKFLELHERASIANKAKADLFVSVHCNAAANKSAKGNETWVLGLHRSDDNLEVVQRENSVILLEDNYEEKYAGFDPNDPSSFAASLLTQEDFLDNSIEMAANVQTKFEEALKRKNRGVKQAGFAVLRLSYMPSVLIETGFITNTEERNFLNSNAGQDKVAQSIFKAILNYQKNRDINNFEVEPVDIEEGNGSQIIAPKESVEKASIVYMVQIAASSNEVAAKSYNFKKLPEISREKSGGIYRYYTGKLSNLEAAVELKKRANNAGYDGAFIVVVENGVTRRL
ncbi:N-acetylmuramoyl-L-alanine amidase [Nonlabens ulvanivorans]|uniref:N-acetylmuramoyl-L-alanine amidase n=2 Tax=Nonlabens ulvanivorans TaxID=906888 RepID=A0A084K057_NONUL|nr:N-acetylmuramoyl-L-alanine amidase [Nonlabens ulvanivorans]PRX12503.1 N-acetylmuramoyl-L-alanine amidase [Nonlabens ulvanivorans]